MLAIRLPHTFTAAVMAIVCFEACHSDEPAGSDASGGGFGGDKQAGHSGQGAGGADVAGQRNGGLAGTSTRAGAAGGAGGVDQGRSDSGVANPSGASGQRSSGLDVLFVVGSWASMGGVQSALGEHMSALLGPLTAANLELRLGVLTANIGARGSGGVVAPGCEKSGGDLARLVVMPGCGLENGAMFLQSGGRSGNNYSGALAAVISCMIKVGTLGCTFGQPLSTLALAQPGLEDSFLRDDADLLIVVASDLDDCSAGPEANLFGSAPDGPPGAFYVRCALAGHQCGGRAVTNATQTWKLSECSLNPHPTEMRPVTDLVERVKGWKRDTRRVSFASVVASPASRGAASYSISSDGTFLRLDPVCGPKVGPLRPALRLEGAAGLFGADGIVVDLCSDDIDAGLSNIASLALRP